MKGYCSPLHPRRRQSSTIVGVCMFAVSDGLHPVLCCTRNGYPCILDLLINCRLHQLGSCSAGAMWHGLGIITFSSRMALQTVSWLWPPLFSSASYYFVLPPCGSFLYWAIWQHLPALHLSICSTPKQNSWSGRCFVNHNPTFHIPIVISISFCLYHCGKHLFWGHNWSFKTTGVGCWSYN